MVHSNCSVLDVPDGVHACVLYLEEEAILMTSSQEHVAGHLLSS